MKTQIINAKVILEDKWRCLLRKSKNYVRRSRTTSSRKNYRR